MKTEVSALAKFRTKYSDKYGSKIFDVLNNLRASTSEYQAYSELEKLGVSVQLADIDLCGDQFKVLEFVGKVDTDKLPYCQTYITPTDPNEDRMGPMLLTEFAEYLQSGALDYADNFKDRILKRIQLSNPEGLDRQEFWNLRAKFYDFEELDDSPVAQRYLLEIRDSINSAKSDVVPYQTLKTDVANNIMGVCSSAFTSPEIRDQQDITRLFMNIQRDWEVDGINIGPEVYSVIKAAYNQLYDELDTGLVSALAPKMEALVARKLETLEDKLAVSNPTTESRLKRFVKAMNPHNWSELTVKRAKIAVMAASMTLAATAVPYVVNTFGGAARDVRDGLKGLGSAGASGAQNNTAPIAVSGNSTDYNTSTERESSTRGRGDLPEELPVCTASRDQAYPKIYNNRIVWQDERNGDWDIYLYDLSIGKETQITKDPSDQRDPAIYGNKIVWQDERNGAWDIYMYDISTGKETQITKDPSNQGFPEIYSNRIVWQDARNGRSDIYMYDISTGKETQITDNDSWQEAPAIYDNKIVWQDERNGDRDIYMYDISTGKETQITDDDSQQKVPLIYGNKIVWADNHAENYDVYIYDISTGKKTRITNDFVDQAPLSIYGNKITLEDERNGNWDIYIYDISTGKETQITEDSSNQLWSAIYGNKIVWHTDQNGGWDIYMMDLSGQTQPDPPTEWSVSDLNLEEICKLPDGYDGINLLHLLAKDHETGEFLYPDELAFYRMNSELELEVKQDADKVVSVKIELEYDYGKWGHDKTEIVDLVEKEPGVYSAEIIEKTLRSEVKAAILLAFNSVAFLDTIMDVVDKGPEVTATYAIINGQRINIPDEELERASEKLDILPMPRYIREAGIMCAPDFRILNLAGRDIIDSQDVIHSGENSEPEIVIYPAEAKLKLRSNEYCTYEFVTNRLVNGRLVESHDGFREAEPSVLYTLEDIIEGPSKEETPSSSSAEPNYDYLWAIPVIATIAAITGVAIGVNEHKKKSESKKSKQTKPAPLPIVPAAYPPIAPQVIPVISQPPLVPVQNYESLITNSLRLAQQNIVKIRVSDPNSSKLLSGENALISARYFYHQGNLPAALECANQAKNITSGYPPKIIIPSSYNSELGGNPLLKQGEELRECELPNVKTPWTLIRGNSHNLSNPTSRVYASGSQGQQLLLPPAQSTPIVQQLCLPPAKPKVVIVPPLESESDKALLRAQENIILLKKLRPDLDLRVCENGLLSGSDFFRQEQYRSALKCAKDANGIALDIAGRACTNLFIQTQNYMLSLEQLNPASPNIRKSKQALLLAADLSKQEKHISALSQLIEANDLALLRR